MRFVFVFAFALCGSLGVASSFSPSFVTHEKRDINDHGWNKAKRAPSHVKLPVRIAIAQRNLHLSHDYLMEISDPASPKYGQHWTPEQIMEMFAPTKESVDAITQWLAHSGIHPLRHAVAASRGSVSFEATVSELEALLDTDYHMFEHSESSDISISCDEYKVPHRLKSLVDFITPTISLSPIKARKVKRGEIPHGPTPPTPFNGTIPTKNNLTSCYEMVTPECIKGSKAHPGNEIGIFALYNYVFDDRSLDIFWQQYTDIPQGTYPSLKSIDGGVKKPQPALLGDPEGLLDVEIAYPLIYPQNVTVFSVSDKYESQKLGFLDPFLDGLDGSYCTYKGGDNKTVDPIYPDTRKGGYNHTEDCGKYKLTNVISVSYGASEAGYSPFYAQRQCFEYMKLGLQGVSVIFATGDSGTASSYPVVGCLPGPYSRYNPNFPASCPYVTAVGATQIRNRAPVTAPEIAVNGFNQYNFTGGGGFSNVFPQPSYQSKAVSEYFANHKPGIPASNYNATGRGFPDVSANGWNIAFVGLFQSTEGGTSASAPIFAGIINLINEERLAAGKKTVGFLNPTLYVNPEAFNDITEGNNWDCNEEVAFSAVTGWDPVTGLGTPNYPKLLEAFMALP